MKRLLAIITILCLCMTTAVFAEDAPAADPAAGGTDAIAGTWVETNAHRATIEITAADGGCSIHVEWPGSASERAVWDIPSGTFNEETGTVTYTSGKQVKRTYKEDGTYEEAVVSENESGTLTLKDGKLTWHREGTEEEDAVFEKTEITPPDFEGEWVETIAHRATVEITAADGGYSIHVEWPGSVSTRAIWDIPNAVYDKEKNALVYANGKETERTYKEDGTYEDKLVSGTATGTFTLKDDGNLLWHRDGTEQEDTTFEKAEFIPPDYSGDWVETIAHRATITITPAGEGYTIQVEWPGSVSSRAIYVMTNAVYDKEKNALVYTNGKEIERNYKADGTYEDKEISATRTGSFTLKDDGKLIWHRDGEDPADTEFEKYEIVVPDYAGDWVGTLQKRARMTVKKTGDDYYVRIEWAGSANSKAIWDIPKATIDTQKNCLVYSNCTEFQRDFKEDGTYQDTVRTTKASGTLTLKDDGKLYWHRNDSPQDDIAFERSDNPFVDVEESDYFYDAVIWAYKNGITTGMSDNEFAPNLSLTRAQVVTFLWRAAGKPAPTTTANPFTDVTNDMYCYEPVLWAVEKGITTGMDETHFAPDSNVTRAQSVTFLYRYMGQKTDTANPFVDVPKDAWYYEAVIWASANKIVNGMDATHFAPEDGCTRGQIVTILYRAR